MSGKKTEAMPDGRVVISTLWIVVMFNMVFADILGMITPGVLSEMMAMDVGQPAILVFAVLLEIPIAMIFLSRVISPTAARFANLAAGLVTIAFVTGGGSPYLHYYFMAGVEILCVVAIMVIAWKFPESKATAREWEAA